MYAALGDSITYGYSSSTQDARYVAKMQRLLVRQQPVNVFVQAKPGWTSAQLLKSLPDVPDCIWAEARLVTILIGGNDLLRATPWLRNGGASRIVRITDKFRRNLKQIVDHVRRPQSTVILATLYNPFPNASLAGICTEAFNQVIRQVAQRERVLLADLNQCFSTHEQQFIKGYHRGELRDFKFFGNPIHPNDAGHDQIARVLVRTYRRSLVRTRTVRQKSR